jgi:regulatory protein
LRFGRSSDRPARKPAVSLHEAALRLLARRAYSRRELKERLESRGYPAADVRTELERLTEVGLLNDEQLAGSVAASQLGRGRGKRAVAVELRRRGLPRTTREAALEGLGEADQAAALERAVDQATARHPGWRELLPARRKVIRYLLARGFDLGVVLDALAARAEAAPKEHDAGDPDDCSDP